jgi:hypothetical protein
VTWALLEQTSLVGGGGAPQRYDRERRPGGFLPGVSVTRLTITTNGTRYLSQPPRQHTRQPSVLSPSSTAWKTRRNFVSTCIVSGHAWLLQRREVNTEIDWASFSKITKQASFYLRG